MTAREPIFETGLLLAGQVDPANVRRQLSRWVRSGKILQLRRGLHVLAPPFRTTDPHPFLVANLMVRASYVSPESALAFHGLIPEYVPTITSVTTGRPRRWETPLGVFEFRHVKKSLLWGYRQTDLLHGQHALVASPEKALLDLLYLRSGADSPAFIAELRLHNLDRIDMSELKRQADHSGSGKLRRAVAPIAELAAAEAEEHEAL